MVDFDTAVIKRFNIGEKVNTEFCGEFFNVMNHPNFALPNATIGSSSAGLISNTVPLGATGYSREIQLEMKISF